MTGEKMLQILNETLTEHTYKKKVRGVHEGDCVIFDREIVAVMLRKLQAAEELAKAVEKEALMGKSAKTRLHQAWYAYRNAGGKV